MRQLRTPKTRVMLCAAGMALLLGAGLAACANSILRNAAEAGIETLLDDPLPTVTPG